MKYAGLFSLILVLVNTVFCISCAADEKPAVVAAPAHSQVVCIASLAQDDAPAEEVRIALALQEIFYYRFCLVPGLTTIMTRGEETGTAYGFPLLRLGEDTWNVPQFTERAQAAAFAEQNGIDLLFFGALALKSGTYTVTLNSTNPKGPTLTVAADEAGLGDAWIAAMLQMAAHAGRPVPPDVRVLMQGLTGIRGQDLHVLGAMMKDMEIDGGLSPDEGYLSAMGIDPMTLADVEKKMTDFGEKCRLPEVLFKFAYYNLPADTRFGALAFVNPIVKQNTSSKPFLYIAQSEYPTLPYHILLDCGYGQGEIRPDPALINSRDYIVNVMSAMAKELIDVLVWYSTEALNKDGDDYNARARMMVLAANADDAERFQTHAGLLKKLYPGYAQTMFEKLVQPGLPEESAAWIAVFAKAGPGLKAD